MKALFKVKKSQFDTCKVPHAQVETLENQGWIVSVTQKYKTQMTRKKEVGRQFEDDIWSMFYRLGFRILNADDNLRVQWGPHPENVKQLDLVAVGDDAIFVVECKAAEKQKKQSFQQALTEIVLYKEGMAESLRQLYGKDKRVKFIFATRNYRIEEDGEDAMRMRNNDIFHLDDAAFNYISKLITSYQSSVIYQFYGLMFKNKIINSNPITIPALRGLMGDKIYYIFSIEPSTLLKIGFVLHRTKVNDTMAPTYQRLLVPSRLKGITKFIDEGGFFPNSIIINFDEPNEETKLTFDPIHKEDSSEAEFGLLNIPNAYGIAYIIDGQHRVYGYSNSKYKETHTIPVVAFQNMPSEEQLKIFMEINENQKAVDKGLRIDLEEDLYSSSSRLDSRMKALRSSVIKRLGSHSGNVLFGKISDSQDSSLLSPTFFGNALPQSTLIPKATHTKWGDNSETSLYDTKETNIDKAMDSARKRIVQYIDGCYEVAMSKMTEDTKKFFLFSNRATYPFVVIIGLLHTYLQNIGSIKSDDTIKERIAKVTPYLVALSKGLNNISEEEYNYLKGIQGQGAEKKWLLAYQDIVNKEFPDYYPVALQEWREMRDKDIQKQGEAGKERIRALLRTLVFNLLKEIYGKDAEKNVAKLKHDCEGRILDKFGDDDNFDPDDYNWKDYIEVNEYKDIIDKNFANDRFAEVFGIKLSDKVKSKKEKLSWISLIEPQKGKKVKEMTKSDLNILWLIEDHLKNFLPTED